MSIIARTAEATRVRELQRTLYRAAKADPGRRFHALHDKVHRRDVLECAWDLVRRNRGAAGIDQITITDVEHYGVDRLLGELATDLADGSYRPLAARRVFIPKPGSNERRPCRSRRSVTVSCRPRRGSCSSRSSKRTCCRARLGFGPGGRRTTRCRSSFDEAWRGQRWVVETDIAACLVASSHCLRVHGGGLEEGVFGVWDPYSQAFSASVADVDGVEVSALDTLQHGLARDAEGPHRVDDRDVAGGCVLDEQRAQLVVDADAPGRAEGVLLAGDEPVVEPAVQGRGRDAEGLGARAIGSISPPSGGSVGGLWAGMLR